MEHAVLEEKPCPRCNARAQIRLDVLEPRNSMIFAFLVCKMCKIVLYQYTTTSKAIKYAQKIKSAEKRLNELPSDSRAYKVICDKIKKMKLLKQRAEIEF